MKNIRSALLFLLTISYVFGLKIVEFSTYPRKYFNLLYVLFFWSIYCFLISYTVIPYIAVYGTLYNICLYVDIFVILLSIIVGIYHNQVRKS